MNDRPETTDSPTRSRLHVTRRDFVRLAAGAAAITAGPWHNLYGSADDCSLAPRSDGRLALPFQAATEVLICGSTLFACDLALQSARAGKRTTLVMEGTNPYFEGTDSFARNWRYFQHDYRGKWGDLAGRTIRLRGDDLTHLHDDLCEPL